MSRPRELAGSFQPTAPSIASSSTSEYSRITNVEEPSSSRPPSSIQGGHIGRYADDGRYSASTQVETQDEDDVIEKRDFAHPRQHRVRRSGAFLLESALPSIRKRAARRPNQGESPADIVPRKSIEPANLRTPPRARAHEQRQTSGSQKNVSISTYGSPSRASASGSADARQALEATSSRQSTDSGSSAHASGNLRSPSIDPAQIVNMALNLSESRRRHLSVGQLPTQSISTGRRISSGARLNGAVMQGSYHDSHMGASLKQALQQQRRDSRNISPAAGHSSPTSRRFTSPRIVSGYQQAPSPTREHGMHYMFSDATLARAEKARKNLELKVEYLRLLQQLPPIFKASDPQTGAEFEAGRQYNPLQAIRNRKVRTRERRPLPVTSDEFDDQHRARGWVDAVENAASARYDKGQQAISLPAYEGASEQATTKENGTSYTSNWPRLDWIMTPSELLADTHWVEQKDNKLFIVDQHGNKVVRDGRLSTTTRPRLSEDLARELDRLSGQFTDRDDVPQSGTLNAGDSDVPSERGRLSRLGTSGHKVIRRPRRRSRQSFSSSSSDEDAALRVRLQPDRAGSDDLNVGPLHRHLNKLLVKETNQTNASPSPDSPNHWGTAYPRITEGSTDLELKSRTRRKHPDDLTSDRPEERRPPLPRSPTSFGASQRSYTRDFAQSSIDDLSTAPSSPSALNFDRSLTSHRRERSPTSSPRGPLPRTHGRSKLGLFQSEARSRDHTGSDSFTDPDEAMASRQTSGGQDVHEADGGTKFVPNIGRKLFSHRRGESLGKFQGQGSSRIVNEHKDARDSNEPPSAVSRFFKGVGNSGTKMGDIILRKDRGAGDSDSVSSTSDDEQRPLGTDGRIHPKKRPVSARATTADTLDSSRSSRGKHFNLPTFRSANAMQESTEIPYTTGDEDDRLVVERGRQPPDLQTRFSGSRQSTNEKLSRVINGDALDNSSRASSHTRQRKERMLAQPGLMKDLPVPPLTRVPLSSDKIERSASRPTLSDKRHWSITDQRRRSTQLARDAVIKPSDIARAQALLLCSGIKARAIYHNAHVAPSEPAPFLLAAYETANGGREVSNREEIRIPRREEHVFAARMLSKDIENGFGQLRASTQHFRDSVVTDLHKQLTGLRDLLADDFSPRVKACGDEADLYAKKLSQNLPLEAKNIYERAGTILRNRRRRGRWLRRGGWAALEYLVLGIMWWAWFIVLLIRGARALLVGIFIAVRWLFWL